MYVVDVIPLSRTAPGTLSYRSIEPLQLGTLVFVTVRKTRTQGIVIGCEPVKDAKTMLKRAGFTLSKSALKAAGELPPELMRAAAQIAAYHATTVGAMLAALFAEYVRADVPIPTAALQPAPGFQEKNKKTNTNIEQPIQERVQAYRRVIEALLQERRAVLLVVPTLQELQFWKRELAAFSPLILSGTLSGEKRSGAITSAAESQGLVITTPTFSWTPIVSLGAVIIERPSAGTYASPKRPYLSWTYALTQLAEERGIPLYRGDFPIALEYAPQHEGIPHALTSEVVDVRRPKDDAQHHDEPWQALPTAMQKRIRAELERGGSVFLLATRKGYSPAVVCRDCEQAQTDDRGLPLSFTTSGGKRRFVTSDGQSEIAASRPCPRCGSWNLLPLGIGIERVAEEVRSGFPTFPLYIFDATILRSPAKARALFADAAKEPGVMVGTEAIFPFLLAHGFLTHPFALGVIVSADSLLALPLWRARERFVRISYLLRELCAHTLLLTRHPEDTAVNAASNPGSPAFWQEERMLRTALAYPPFGTIIILTAVGMVKRLDAVSTLIEQQLSPYSLTQLSDRIEAGVPVRRTWVLRLPLGGWPNHELSAVLAQLPPSIRVLVDPESIW
jgi:primosomal protein N'